MWSQSLPEQCTFRTDNHCWLLNTTGIRPSDVDILVTNCSIFCPTPSLASVLVNHFKFRSDIQTYHLGGEVDCHITHFQTFAFNK